MQRTVRLTLKPTPEQAQTLLDTANQFTEAFNVVCEAGWAEEEKNGVRLHHLTYRSLKERLPALVSDLHIQARVKATEALKSAFTRKKQGRKISCPHSRLCAPRYNVHTFKVDWAASSIRLSTTAGRLSVPFTLPAVFAWATTGKICTADLVIRDGRYRLHVVIETPTPEVPPSGVVVGVDMGLCHPAVTSERQFLGEQRWTDVEARLFRQKRQCQAKGTKSAKRKLRSLRGRQARFRRDCDHVLSRRIVDSVPPGSTVVLENLKDIRSRIKQRKGKQNRRFHGWSFAQLKSFVAYKAETVGSQVVLIDPRHTSQTCPRCGQQHRNNRKSQSLFQCRSCGYRLNADLAGAINIRDKHQGVFGIPLDARPQSTGPTGRKT